MPKKCGVLQVNLVWTKDCNEKLTVDGSARIPPLITFKGTGLWISAEEKKQFDKRVAVVFQIKAWCDEEVMKKRMSEQWGNTLLNPPTNGSSGKILFADIHKAQQTDTVKIMLKKHKTTLINVPGGTSRVQTLDISINKPFKNHARKAI